MELIDREALKDAVKRYAGEPIKSKDKKCQAICLDMLGTIDAQPPIDAVPVVRCRECRWGHLCVMGQHLGLDGFCSKGKMEVQE